MIKHITTLLFLGFSVLVNAQPLSGEITNYNHSAMEIVIFPFGVDYPVKIGKVDKDGQVNINLDTVDISKIPAKIKNSFWARVTETFFTECDDPASLNISNKIKALDCGAIFLWKDNQTQAAIFLTSDEKLKPWLEDRYYKEPVKGSFYELLFLDQELSLNTGCTVTYNLGGSDEIMQNNFQINFKKGFNLVQYTIEEIFKTDPEETTSVPSKVLISNLQKEVPIKWLVNFFYE